MRYLPELGHFYLSLRRKWRVAQNFREVSSAQRAEGSRSAFPHAPLVIGVASEPGYRRKNNTDSYGVFETYATPDGAAGEMIPVAVVASSVSNHGLQQRASQLAVETIYTTMRRHEHRPIQQLLVEAIQQANRTIDQQAATDPQLSGIGATTVVAAILHHTLYLAYVGDCRAYLVRKDAIHRLTVPPHWSPTAYLPTPLMAGTRRVALPPPRVERVLDPAQVLGRTDFVEVATTIVPFAPQFQPANSRPRLLPTNQLALQANDILLLCTPGLHHAVSDEEIAHTAAHYPIQEAAWQLAAKATQAQTGDSYTVLLMQQPHGPSGRKRWAVLMRLLVVPCLLLLVIGWFALAKYGSHLARVVDSLPSVLVIPFGQEQSSPEREAEGVHRASALPRTPLSAPKADATPAQERINAPATRLVGQPTVAAARAARVSNGWQRVPVAVGQIFTRLGLTTTLKTFPQRVSDTLTAAGAAVAAAHTATAVAALPPTPTVTPPPRPTLPTRTPTRTPTLTAQATPVPARANFDQAAVALLAPAEQDTLNEKRPFCWQANFALPPGYAFELVFWQRGQEPLKHGKGYAGLTEGTCVNAGYEHFRLRDAPEGEYRWGVLLVSKEPYQRVKYLGGDRVIYVKRS